MHVTTSHLYLHGMKDVEDVQARRKLHSNEPRETLQPQRPIRAHMLFHSTMHALAQDVAQALQENTNARHSLRNWRVCVYGEFRWAQEKEISTNIIIAVVVVIVVSVISSASPPQAFRNILLRNKQPLRRTPS